MPTRFIFRQVYFADLPTFLADGEIRSKNHASPQSCHQTSYQEIVDRRGSREFVMPNGGVVNDFVPFYFSPITPFTCAIYKRKVPLVSPAGQALGQASEDDRIFFVAKPDSFRGSKLCYYFSNLALNSHAPPPSIISNLDHLETHVEWGLFDENPIKAAISEIGYAGVCQFFHSRSDPIRYMNRSPKRMAEFLVHGAVPLDHVACLIAKTDFMRDKLVRMMDASAWKIPIYTKSGCYFE
jgi:hypothetical protein